MNQQSIEDENLVERYVTGHLSAAEAAGFEEYFLAHPECAAEVDAAQRLHRGLAAVAAQEAVRTSLALGLWSRLLRNPFARLAPLVLVALLAVPLFLQSRRIERLESSLETAQKLQINTPIFELTPFRGSGLGSPPANLLTLSPDPEQIVLALAVPSGQATCRVELLAADDRVVWEAAELHPDPLGRLVMILPSTLLPPGDYELRVTGTTAGAAPVPVARFPLSVAVGS